MKLPIPREIAERVGLSQETEGRPDDLAEAEEAGDRPSPECIVGRMALPIARRATETQRVVDAFLRDRGIVSGPIAQVVRGGKGGLKLVGMGGEAPEQTDGGHDVR